MKEKLENVKRIEDKVYYGETITGFEIEEKRDWEKVLKEHKERIENETKERERQIEKKEIKEKSWELYIECKGFLESNEKNMEKQCNEGEAFCWMNCLPLPDDCSENEQPHCIGTDNAQCFNDSMDNNCHWEYLFQSVNG